MERKGDRQKTFGYEPSCWAKWLGQDSCIPDDLPDRKLSRADLHDIWRTNDDPEVLFLCTMAWGGMRAPNRQKAWENRCVWKPLIERLRKLDTDPTDRASLYQAFYKADLDRIGPAYFTKLIFFATHSQPKRQKSPGYIMDQWTAKSVNLLLGRNLVALTSGGYVEGPKISSKNCPKVYSEFCLAIEELAKRLECTPTETEETLFSRGRSRFRNGPPEGQWRTYVRQHYKRQ